MAPFLATTATVLAAWLLTYALHSTVLLGSAWLLTRLKAMRAPEMRDLLWKTAILGGLATTTLQLTLLTGPQLATIASSDFALPESAPALQVEVPMGLGADASGPFDAQIFFDAPGEGIEEPFGITEPDDIVEFEEAFPPEAAAEVGFWQNGFARAEAIVGGALAKAKAAATTWRADVPLLASILLGLWLVGALATAVWQLAIHWTFLRTVGRRRRITDPHLIALAHEVGESAGVRQSLCHKLILTAARGIGSPVALGKNEICLPERALTDLEPDELRGVLAHEWAHLVRRDPLWLRICLLLETLFFFQPLGRIGRQQQMEAAEFLCDAWAVRYTGERHALAQSLVRVAAWLRSEPRRIYGPVMASQGSPLGERVRTLLGETTEVARDVPAGYRLALAGALVLAVAWLVPGVGIENHGAQSAFAQERFDDGEREDRALRRAEARRELAGLSRDLARLESDTTGVHFDFDFSDLARLEGLSELEELAESNELASLERFLDDDAQADLEAITEEALTAALSGASEGLADAQSDLEREIAELERQARTAENAVERFALRQAAIALSATTESLRGQADARSRARSNANAIARYNGSAGGAVVVESGDKLELSWEEGSASFTVKICGPVRFSEGGKRIEHMGEGSCVYVHEHGHDARGNHTRTARTLHAEPGPQGSPKYTYKEDDRRLTFDTEAAEWLARTLGQLHQRAAATIGGSGSARGNVGSTARSGWGRSTTAPPAPPTASVPWVQGTGGSSFERSGMLRFNWNDGAVARSVSIYGSAKFDARTGMPLEVWGGDAKIVIAENVPGDRDRKVVVAGRSGDAPRYSFGNGADRAWVQEVMRQALDHGLRGNAASRYRVAPVTPPAAVTPPVASVPRVRVAPTAPPAASWQSRGHSHHPGNTTGGTRTSNWTDDDVRRSITVEGAVTFDPESGAVLTISRGGSVTVEEKTRRYTRRVVITPVRGDALDYDFSGHQANHLWLKDFWCQVLEDEHKNGGIGDAQARIDELLSQGRGNNTARALDGIERLDDDTERRHYYVALLGHRLSESDTRRVLRHAGDHLSSDFEKRQVLQYALQQRPSEAICNEALAVAGDMDSDFERRQVLIARLGRPLGTEALRRYFDVTGDMDSDFERRQVLIALLGNQHPRSFPPQQRAQFLSIVGDMDSDFEKRQVMLNAIRTFDLEDREVLIAYLGIVGDMDSDFEKRQLLQQFGRLNLDANEKVAVLGAIEDMDSDFERATLLRGLVRWYEDGSARVRKAYRDAGEGISRSHRQGIPGF